MKEKIAVFAGSFDPITLGHVNIVQRALKVFDKVHIVIAINGDKKYLFSNEQKLAMIKNTFIDHPQIEVSVCHGVVVDYAGELGASALIRGLRNSTDLDYEYPISILNSQLGNDIETFCILADKRYSYMSSSIVRELIRIDKDIAEYVPTAVVEEMLLVSEEMA